MGSDEAIKKMIHAIMDKRKKIGIPDWGQADVMDVIERLNRTHSQDNLKEKPCEDPKPESE